MIRRIKIVDRPEEVLYIKFWAIVLAIYVISSAIGLFHGYLWSRYFKLPAPPTLVIQSLVPSEYYTAGMMGIPGIFLMNSQWKAECLLLDPKTKTVRPNYENGRCRPEAVAVEEQGPLTHWAHKQTSYSRVHTCYDTRSGAEIAKITDEENGYEYRVNFPDFRKIDGTFDSWNNAKAEVLRQAPECGQ